MTDNLIKNDIDSKILVLRGKEVMLDRDLAVLYEVETRALKQAVKRNIDRFPDDFMFELTDGEIDMMVSQSVIPSRKHFGGAKPYAFTEQGVYMLATVLKSVVATKVNIAIMRTFARLREFGRHYNALAKKIIEVERKSDKQYRELKKSIEKLIEESESSEELRKIGFLRDG